MSVKNMNDRLVDKRGFTEAATSAAKKVRSRWRDARHLADEFIFRLPNPLIATSLRRKASPAVSEATRRLRRDGILLIPDVATGSDLQGMKERFDAMIHHIESSPAPPEQPLPRGHYVGSYREHGKDPEAEMTYTYDPFKYDDALLRVALDEFLLEVVARYFNRRFMPHQSTAARYYPTEARDFSSWQWHHDAWGKRINAMFLLTDVGERDQFMTYLRGSHRQFHSRHRYAESRFTREEVEAAGDFESVDCLGSAGSMWVFDPNGFHRGNRSLGAVRDSVITSYSCGRYIWPFQVPRTALATLSPRQREVLQNNPRVSYH